MQTKCFIFLMVLYAQFYRRRVMYIQSYITVQYCRCRILKSLFFPNLQIQKIIGSMSSSSSGSSPFESTAGISAYFLLFSTLLALVLVLSKVLHDHPALNSIFPEAGMVLLVGAVAGLFVNLLLIPTNNPNDDTYSGGSVVQSLLSFSPNVFFVALLPPIIFNSGYHLRRELFFRHIVPITLFAVVGTVVSAISVSLMLEMVKGLGLTGGFAPSEFVMSKFYKWS